MGFPYWERDIYRDMNILLSEAQIKLLIEDTTKSFNEFASKRLAGAEKIAKSAKEKGGPAMLTYHHFNVKLPYYKDAAEGKFNVAAAIKEFDYCVNKLNSKMENMKQVEFQKLLGQIEVLGELIIKHK